MNTTSSIAASQILHHTAAFLSEALSQSELRHRYVSTLRRRIVPSDLLKLSLRPLNLAAETLEKAISTSNLTVQCSSLRLAEKLLVSLPESTFSSFLLSLIYSLSQRAVNASISLLRVFSLDPSFARSELAPALFEELFLVHFLPVLQWFDQQRSSILSSMSQNASYNNEDYSICDVSVVVPCTKLLSKISGDQASELKELERNYEQVLDENCRAFAKYFSEVLQDSNGDGLTRTPSLVLEQMGKRDELENSTEHNQRIKTEEPELRNGRYNVIL